MIEERLRRDRTRLSHGVQRVRNPSTLRFGAHVGGEQRAGADRLGEDDFVTRLHAALLHELLARLDLAHQATHHLGVLVRHDESVRGDVRHAVDAGLGARARLLEPIWHPCFQDNQKSRKSRKIQGSKTQAVPRFIFI